MIAAGNAKVTTGMAGRVARILLENGAVQVNREKLFVYTSGIRSPIYCDLRVLIDSPSVRAQVVESLIKKVSRECDLPATDVIAGVVSSGVPWAAWVAEKLGKRMAYVRPEPKAHGKQQRVEGNVRGGDTVIVIEDHISTGGSALRAVEALRDDRGAQANHCFSIFTYDMPKAREEFEKARIKLDSLCGISVLLEVGHQTGHLTEDDVKAVKDWLERQQMATVG